MEFSEKQIFQRKFDTKYKETCDKARNHREPYCRLRIKATTKENVLFGIPGGRKVSLLVIIPLAFETLPVLSLQNSRDMFVTAYNALSKVSAIENCVLNRHPRRKHVLNFLRRTVNKIKGFATVGDVLALAWKLRKGAKSIPLVAMERFWETFFNCTDGLGSSRKSRADTSIEIKFMNQVSAF